MIFDSSYDKQHTNIDSNDFTSLYERYPRGNLYSMNCPFELLQIRNSIYGEEGAVTLFTSNTNGNYYASFSTSNIDREHQTERSKVMNILHSHEYYEFLFVIDGEIYQDIEHSRHYYPAGGCCLVNPDVLHSEEYDTECRVLFFKMSREFFQNLVSVPRYFSVEENGISKRIKMFLDSDHKYIDFIPANGYEWVKNNIHSIFEKMMNELSEPSELASIKLSLYTQQLLLELFDKEKFSNTPVEPGNAAEQQFFQDIHDYMIKAEGKVTRGELESHFNYSGDYIYKIIKAHTGLSINDYGSYICMKKAADMLINSSMRINSIADSVGFHNYTHFYKAFALYYGMTPREYRIKNRT